MKIAIISDTHDNWANFKKVIEWLNKEKINLILHCGDISRQETLNEMKRLFNGEIKFVRGNADVDLIDIPESDEVESNGKKIAFAHFKEPAVELCKSGKYDLVFYGHTHKPWMEEINGCRLVNPGEMAGQFYKPTFAIYNLEKDNLELKIIERLV
jgi:hypothetical protein